MPPKTKKENLSSLTKKSTTMISKKKNHKPVGVVEKRTEKKNRPTNHDAESNNGEQQKP